MNSKDSNIKIKICGLKETSELKCAVDYGVFWYGMVFFDKSPRNISLKKAETLLNVTPKTIIPVAVTVNPSLFLIRQLIELGIKDIQLHGEETVDFCKKLKKDFNLNIIKAISVSNTYELKIAYLYKACVDWLLFDYKDQLVAGGSGKSFDWKIISNKNFNFNWILSGGLDYNNIQEAINTTQAKALDVSSGVEVEKGKKSIELIKKFCRAANNNL